MNLSIQMLRMLAATATASVCGLLATNGCAGEPTLDPDALAWIEEAKDANARADRALEDDDRDRARALLDAVLESTPPATITDDDRRVVLQDVRYRLASIDLEDGQPERALEHVVAGLAQGRAHDVFTANLQVTRGRALEALDRDVEAADAYFEALEINDALLRQMLDRSDETEEP